MAFKPIKIWAGRDSVPDLEDPEFTDYWHKGNQFKLYHNSEHRFEPGDIVDPTTSIYIASLNQGMDEEDVKHRDKTPMAWAAATPDYQKTYHRYTYEVEPITKHSVVEEDPVGFENGEYAAPEGYRVKQVVWDKEKDSCASCKGYGKIEANNNYPYPKCSDCFGTGLSTSKIAGLQKAGYKLDEIKNYIAPRNW